MSEWQVSLVYQDEKSHKFWRIRANDTTLETNYGRVGSKGQTSTKNFASAGAAEKEVTKQANAKRKKGYVDELGAIPDKPKQTEKPVLAAKTVSLDMQVGQRVVQVELSVDGHQLKTVASEKYASQDDAQQAFEHIQQALLNDGYQLRKG